MDTEIINNHVYESSRAVETPQATQSTETQHRLNCIFLKMWGLDAWKPLLSINQGQGGSYQDPATSVAILRNDLYVVPDKPHFITLEKSTTKLNI